MNKDGTVFILRIGRRHSRRAELWLTLRIPGVGVLQSPVHPDTAIYNTDGKTLTAAGLRFEMLEPNRRWKIKFNGLLRYTTLLGLVFGSSRIDQLNYLYLFWIYQPFSHLYLLSSDLCRNFCFTYFLLIIVFLFLKERNEK